MINIMTSSSSISGSNSSGSGALWIHTNASEIQGNI